MYIYIDDRYNRYIILIKKIAQLCNPTAGSKFPGLSRVPALWFRSGFSGNPAPLPDRLRLKPNRHCCWEEYVCICILRMHIYYRCIYICMYVCIYYR